MAVWNSLDWILVAIFTITTLMGFLRGFVSEIISIITLIAAVIIAITFADSFAIAIMDYSTIQNLVARSSNAFGGNTTDAISYLALAVSFIILFTGTILAGAIVKLFLNLAFQTGILGIGNRLLGGIFGLAKGYIFNLVLLFLIQLTALSEQPWWQESYFVPMFQSPIVWLNGQVAPVISQLTEKVKATNMGTKVQELMSAPENPIKK